MKPNIYSPPLLSSLATKKQSRRLRIVVQSTLLFYRHFAIIPLRRLISAGGTNAGIITYPLLNISDRSPPAHCGRAVAFRVKALIPDRSVRKIRAARRRVNRYHRYQDDKNFRHRVAYRRAAIKPKVLPQLAFYMDHAK